MKYDRPVWQIMHACADDMPDVFRYEDVRTWFAEHYPDVNEATIRAHLIGLTEGGRAKHVQFAQRSPVFRRVARGEYEAIPLEERGEAPDARPPSASRVKMSGNGAHLEDTATRVDAVQQVVDEVAGSSAGGPRSGRSVAKTSTSYGVELSLDDEEDEPDPDDRPDVVLLGSLGDRVNVPAPAKEVYREVPFQLSRIEAETAGVEWFVLSAEHGLVTPNEWVSPDSRTMADMEPDYRSVWAAWVVTRLESLVGPVDGLHVRVIAPVAFLGPLFAGLQDAGALVSSGQVGEQVPPVRQHAGTHALVGSTAVDRVILGRRSDDDVEDEPVDDALPDDSLLDDSILDDALADEVPEVLATVTAMDRDLAVARHLGDRAGAVPASDVAALPDAPGLYGWHVDPVGARVLNRCLMLPVRPGLVFVGQVGGSSWHGLADPVLNLRDHVGRIQLHGRARASTFRMTLATVLRAHLRMRTVDDPELTDWMLRHLSVTWWAEDDLGALRHLEQRVVEQLDPPLNVDHLPASEYRTRLSQMRSRLA